MKNIRRKLFSQNFLHNRKLVRKLVANSSVAQKDVVLEIGSGKGILTEELESQAKQVIAVEIDNQWCEYLQQKFISIATLTIEHADFLTYPLPHVPYKVFANIPFAIEGKIIRKLIEDDNPPSDCYLIIDKKLAQRLLAVKRENMFSVMHKPWFKFSIEYQFDRRDFEPLPKVDAVLFHFCQQKQPLLPIKVREKYWWFVQLAFTNGQPIRNNLRKKYPIGKVDSTMQELSVPKKAKPTAIKLNQWIQLFEKLNTSRKAISS